MRAYRTPSRRRLCTWPRERTCRSRTAFCCCNNRREREVSFLLGFMRVKWYKSDEYWKITLSPLFPRCRLIRPLNEHLWEEISRNLSLPSHHARIKYNKRPNEPLLLRSRRRTTKDHRETRKRGRIKRTASSSSPRHWDRSRTVSLSILSRDEVYFSVNRTRVWLLRRMRGPRLSGRRLGRWRRSGMCAMESFYEYS